MTYGGRITNLLSKQYYEERNKKFYDLRLGSMSMKELSSNFQAYYDMYLI